MGGGPPGAPVSWRDAPLYVEAHALATEVAARSVAWTVAGHGALAGIAVEVSQELLGSVGCALTFPAERAADLDRIDRALVRLRLLLRVASDLGLVTAGAARQLATHDLAIGRMVGGWRKRLSPPQLGCRSPPAAGA